MSDLGWALAIVSFAGYALVSRRLTRTPITGPMVFVAIGILAGPTGLDAFDVSLTNDVVGILLEITLVIVLFTDALAIDLRGLRQESLVPGRLLGIGFPLTIAAGLVAAVFLFDVLGFWEAAIVAVVLAPTDAALGQAVVTNSRVPRLTRQGLSVESGLNDGLAVPVLSVFLIQAQIAAEVDTTSELGRVFLEEVGIAVAVGLVVGWLGGKAVVLSSRHDWMGPVWRGVCVTALAILTFAVANPLGGSGFLAAFVGGATFGYVARDLHPNVGEHAEGMGYILTMVSFFVFGALMLGPSLDHITGSIVIYAILSLTIVRILPVAVAMIGSGLEARTVTFLGWFGPRGLASLVFAVTIVADSGLPNAGLIIQVISVAVGLSVFMHGATAWPLSHRYANWYTHQSARRDDMTESVPVDYMGERRRTHPQLKPKQ